MENKKINILVVDDEESILNFLKMGLEAEGFIVHCAMDGKTAVNIARDLEPNIIILDIMLPELNGYEACAEIKKFTDTPIIMLTARDDVDDRVKGLDIGADDYMSKPFSYRELVARIRARLRTNNTKGNSIEEKEINLGKFSVNQGAHEIKYKGNIIELSPTEYKLLKYLLDNKGMVLSKAKILDNVWGYDFYGDENVVEVYIRYLRNKIGDKNYKIIQTVRGAGYKVNIDEE
ncbi:MAG: response regulator transcription factor [Peptostreptococcaceae bacterium]